MKTITEKQYDDLVTRIYNVLISNPEVGLGEIGECTDSAKQIAKEWTDANQIGIESPSKFLVVAYYGGPYKGSPQGRSENIIEAQNAHEAELAYCSKYRYEFIQSVTPLTQL